MLKYLAYGPVAQGIEHRFPKPGVDGSNPPGVTIRQRAQRHCCPWVFFFTSRRDALWLWDLTERRSARERPSRLRLYVRHRGQTALFRRACFSSPAQTWRRLTEKRTLRVKPHQKAHSATWTSRRSALCSRPWPRRDQKARSATLPVAIVVPTGAAAGAAPGVASTGAPASIATPGVASTGAPASVAAPGVASTGVTATAVVSPRARCGTRRDRDRDRRASLCGARRRLLDDLALGHGAARGVVDCDVEAR